MFAAHIGCILNVDVASFASLGGGAAAPRLRKEGNPAIELELELVA